tara:strand:+ start:1039 stop:1260 length:222 start_codon:yes stop_codon:yes gene_type:complete
MKTIKEIITRINYLENNGKQIQKEQGDNYWLKEINYWERLFVNHPEADDTCTYKGNLIMKDDVSVEDFLKAEY